MKTPENFGQKEKELKKYTYRDNSAGEGVVFECVATDVLEADKMYEEKTGKNLEKQSHIACSIEKIEDAD